MMKPFENTMISLAPTHWADYELIDSGNFEKLERFGKYILVRPEPQAVWDKSQSEPDWEKLCHIRFRGRTATTGDWLKKDKSIPDRWNIGYKTGRLNLRFRLALTAFKHVGIFPEQAANWDYIAENLANCKGEQPKFLNLFAYTGGASLAARCAGADVTHVDSIKQVVTWANENQELCGLDGIRWVVEDALKYAAREEKRGKKYQGIILDPPAYGNGPNGEKWILDDKINELVRLCSRILAEKDSFLILNMYSMGLSALVADNLIQAHFRGIKEKELGEMYLPDRFGKRLPLGTFIRIKL